MNFHSTTNSRIREIATTVSMEHRIIVHYSYSRDVVRDATVMVVVKNVKEVMRK